MLFSEEKRTIINDPVHGFITLSNPLVKEVIKHPWFQRLRRIKQMGFAEMVYPGAVHTRFLHALGAMHLMGKALAILQSKGVNITEEEIWSAQTAILLHDIGHGPFSHALEETILDLGHEELGRILMEEMNQDMQGNLSLAISMYENSYERKFFNQLITSQLDVDRLDYLGRDSFFTGVVEGAVGSERILHMLHVHEGILVIEEKGLNSVEHFLNVRRLMYWQVYFHKTNIAAEQMLIRTLKRARQLLDIGKSLDAPADLLLFLQNQPSKSQLLEEKKKFLPAFNRLDDSDIWSTIKAWSRHSDKILSYLSQSILKRSIFKVHLQNEPFEEARKHEIAEKIAAQFSQEPEFRSFLIMEGKVGNQAYIGDEQAIHVLTKKGELVELAKASDLPQIKAITKRVEKYYLCRPRV